MWCLFAFGARLNAIRLEEKEKREKELLNQIIDEADEYKTEFYRKRQLACETNKANNRDKEKVASFSLYACFLHHMLSRFSLVN